MSVNGIEDVTPQKATRFVMVTDLKFPRGPFFTPAERKVFIDGFSPPNDSWIWISAMQSTFQAGCNFSRQHFSDGTSGLVCTGIAGRIAFQFLMRRWNEPRPSFQKILAAMEPSILPFRNVTTQIFPGVRDAVTWPPSEYFEDKGFEAFARRWGGTGRIKA